MNQRSLLKTTVSSLKEQSDFFHLLEVTKNLIIIIKKFGKQLSEPSVKTFVQQHYSEEYQLYEFLG